MSDQPRMKSKHILLSDEHIEFLREYAFKNGISLNESIRIAVQAMKDENESELI